jgi:hypothetical protein
MANAYKYRPQYTRNELGPSGGTGEPSSPAVAPLEEKEQNDAPLLVPRLDVPRT